MIYQVCDLDKTKPHPVRMKSSAFASDEIKSAIHSCRKADFIAKRFHPRSGFIPTKADLVEKNSSEPDEFFSEGQTGVETENIMEFT